MPIRVDDVVVDLHVLAVLHARTRAVVVENIVAHDNSFAVRAGALPKNVEGVAIRRFVCRLQPAIVGPYNAAEDVALDDAATDALEVDGILATVDKLVVAHVVADVGHLAGVHKELDAVLDHAAFERIVLDECAAAIAVRPPDVHTRLDSHVDVIVLDPEVASALVVGHANAFVDPGDIATVDGRIVARNLDGIFSVAAGVVCNCIGNRCYR